MAELTTTSGAEISFAPGAVTAVTGQDVETGRAVTTVYGLTGGHVRIAESVEGFLARIGVLAQFARLTRPDGSPIWINAHAAELVRAPLAGEYPPAARAVVSVGGMTQAVCETAIEVKSAVDAHGGAL